PDAPPSSAMGPLRAHDPKLSSASPQVRIPVFASTAIVMMKIIQPIASQAPGPSPGPRRRPSPPAYTAPARISALWPRSPPSMDSSTISSSGDSISPTSAVSGSCSGTADPRVDDCIEEVDEEVDEDEQDGDHDDVALELDVLAGEDRLPDLLAHAGD